MVDRKTCQILGCHVIGERAVDIVQTAAIAIASGMQDRSVGEHPTRLPDLCRDLGSRCCERGRELKLQWGWPTNPDAPFEGLLSH